MVKDIETIMKELAEGSDSIIINPGPDSAPNLDKSYDLVYKSSINSFGWSPKTYGKFLKIELSAFD